MPMMQIFVSDELDKKIKYYMVKNSISTKNKAMTELLEKVDFYK